MDMHANTATGRDTARLYSRLEERIMARDQVGASEVFYDVVRAGRPLNEIIAEGVRIHAPYTHVPYHERIDDGYPNFVNNDHCLLSARATLHLTKLLPADLAMLPMAQTIWYIPTGLDIWNQKINQAPGHYTRGFTGRIENPPTPVVYWADQQPLRSDAPLHERLGDWLTMVQRGEVLDAYRGFLGMMEDKANRKRVLAEMVFAGLIDVQDRMYRNRSYTTGHKAYRARSTVELGNALRWDNAHNVIYAGALDIAVGPRWHSLYEMACNTVKEEIEGVALHAVPYGGVSEAELAMLRNTAPLTAEDEFALLRALLHEHSPANLDAITSMLKAGRDPRRIVDVIQLAAAEIVLATHGVNNFSMPMHCYEYTNALGWFYDSFDHPRRLRLLYVAAEFVNMTAWHQKLSNAFTPAPIHAPACARTFTAGELLRRIDAAICSLHGPESLSWVQSYCDNVADRAPLVRTLALAACKLGNDPHNQEIPQNMLEDFAKNRSGRRDRLLLACAQHCAAHRKYGDPFEAAQRFAGAMGVALS
ncbi:MAG TPA: hypothetical protein VKI44_13665 [Acetobacteraceae bacterium]|nr:hypothetical protein [Acetobacteraceae bacterium]